MSVSSMSVSDMDGPPYVPLMGTNFFLGDKNGPKGNVHVEIVDLGKPSMMEIIDGTI